MRPCDGGAITANENTTILISDQSILIQVPQFAVQALCNVCTRSLGIVARLRIGEPWTWVPGLGRQGFHSAALS